MALNRIVPDRFLVPAALAGAGLTALLARAAGASWEDQGLSHRRAAAGIEAGMISGGIVAAVTAAGMLFPPTRRFYQDERIIRQSHIETAYQALVRIPLGTALGEEIVFRGAVTGLLRQRFPLPIAAAASSALFGLWHVIPTLDRFDSSPLTRDRGEIHRTVSTAAVVAVTTVFGFGFELLRAASSSVVAPTMAHAAANSVGLAGGWVSNWVEQEIDRVAAEVRARQDTSG